MFFGGPSERLYIFGEGVDMHISEGILSAGTCLAGYCGTAVFTAWGLKKTDRGKIPATALMGAAFFTSSLIHFRIGVTSVHLTLLGLTSIILGPSSILAIVSGLFFQAIMFQHGGITTLGINGLIMIIPVLIGQLFFRALTKERQGNKVFVSICAGIVSGFILLMATALTALIVMAGGDSFMGIAAFFTIGNSILAIAEGLISVVIVNRLMKIKPEMIGSWV